MNRAKTQMGIAERRWAMFGDALATRLWPLPVIAIVAAVALGVVVPLVDAAVDDDLDGTMAALLFGSGASAARAVLSAIAGSMITVTSLTFSLTVVALQLASSQASPRVLRMFAADRTVHATLALFLGTFAYALTVLRTVSDADDGFTPRIAVTLASLLTFASVIQLTLFLAHLATQLRVETVMRDVHAETLDTIKLLAHTPDDPASSAPARPAAVGIVAAPQSGFITGIARHRLLDVAREYDLIVRELRAVGSNVIAGTALIEWWPAVDESREIDDETRADIEKRCGSALHIDYERTTTQDAGYGVRQLVDIASRALSPGVNDPTTAVHAIGHLSALLAEFGTRPPEAPAFTDSDGVARLIPAEDHFRDLLELAMQQPRRYGIGDPTVVRRLYGMLDELAELVSLPVRRDAIADQLERLDASVAKSDYLDGERDEFAVLAATVHERLTTRPRTAR